MDCQWENWLGVTQLSDVLEIKTIVLKKDKLKAEKVKLAVFFEQLEHCSAQNSEDDFLYSSADNKSNFCIKGCLSGKNLIKISTYSRNVRFFKFGNANWIIVLLWLNKMLHLHL